MLAKRVRKRRLTRTRPWLRQPATAFEELPIGINQTEKRHLSAQQPTGQSSDAIEFELWERIKEFRALQRAKPFGRDSCRVQLFVMADMQRFGPPQLTWNYALACCDCFFRTIYFM